MKKSIIAIILLTLLMSITYYFYFNTKKIYKENWNMYMSDAIKENKKTYGQIISINKMSFTKKSMQKILDKNNFKEIDENIYEIYNYIDKNKLEKYIKLDEIKNYCQLYILLTKEDNKFDLLLLNVKTNQILSINNLHY